ncbi:MAG: biotin synthase BioB [Isosphaeraceae bacterium]
MNTQTARDRVERAEIASIYHLPLMDLIGRANAVHRAHHNPTEVQVCVLLSIKTGGCPEDCAYCSQSARYNTAVDAQALMPVDDVLNSARAAKASGATRFCMGAAWREVRSGPQFDRVLEMIRGVAAEGLEVCCTLGMVTPEQAVAMKEAGLHAYNHNLDTSAAHYNEVIHTRTYEDRLKTLAAVRDAGISVCCGGILGLGETDDDRIDLLHTLANLPEPPESVPVNRLVAIDGTPLEGAPPVSVWSMLRMIATARILIPFAMVRLSAGRLEMTEAEQALCFTAGANSIFAGDKLLTTPNPATDRDAQMLATLGLTPRPAYANPSADSDCHSHKPAAETSCQSGQPCCETMLVR